MNVHRRSAHPESYHSERTVEIGAAISARSKRRWGGEEEAIVAHEDARLREKGMPSLKVCAELAVLLPHRTKEAIKTHRFQLKYRNLVESYQVASGDGGHRPHTTPASENQSD